MFTNIICLFLLSFIFHLTMPVCCSIAVKVPSSVAKINKRSSFSYTTSRLELSGSCKY